MDYRKLFDYDYWANSETLASLKSVPSGAEKPRKTFSYVIGAHRVWLSRFENPAPPSAQPWPELTLEECAAAIDDLRRQWKDLLENLAAERLAGELTYKTTKGIEYKTPVSDILTHLILHSAYHRGQVAAAVRGAGGEPAATDYVVYVRVGKR